VVQAKIVLQKVLFIAGRYDTYTVYATTE
jgi:hypothetical protein